ncbi:tripartite tricarboxylate transporter TctB family protein [Oceanobacillus sojae]|uniref:tripartite tricarboxylate transporter TctB family protein n=1 Tax=Oceanobacillus sojae TaxID=582851 RepID=UPI00158A4DD5|nr:tripartite tricarboxylate transporter TctB family protein [Oceanobacillus sojae]
MLLKNSDFYLSIFFIGLSIFIFIQSLQMPEQAQQFPMLISIPLCIFSCALLVKTAIRKKGDAIFDIANIRKVSILLFLMIVYVFLLPILGYFISSLLLFISTFIIMGYRKIISGSITAIVVVTAIFFLFDTLLNIPLPQNTFIG